MVFLGEPIFYKKKAEISLNHSPCGSAHCSEKGLCAEGAGPSEGSDF